MKQAVLALCFLQVGCVSMPASQALKITDFQQGLTRPDGKGGWEIYEKGDDFRLIVNGSCIVAGKKEPCMRHAVSFAYESTHESTTITCTATFSEPTDIVDVNKQQGAQVTHFSGEVSLKGSRGQVFWHGYTIPDGNTRPHRTLMRCLHDDTEVLSYHFTVTEQRNNSIQSAGQGTPASD